MMWNQTYTYNKNMTKRQEDYKVNKILFVATLSFLAIMAFNQNTESEHSTTGQSAMMIAIDPTDGSFQIPSQQQRSALKTKRQTLEMQADEFKYRDTLKVHPDGTKSGVINPWFLHSIHATRNSDGKIVMHESKEPVAAQQPLEVE